MFFNIENFVKYVLNSGCSQNQNHLASLSNVMESVRRILMGFDYYFSPAIIFRLCIKAKLIHKKITSDSPLQEPSSSTDMLFHMVLDC